MLHTHDKTLDNIKDRQFQHLNNYERQMKTDIT